MKQSVNNLPPEENGESESLKNVREYVEDFNNSMKPLEGLELAPDKSVRIKLKGEKKVIVFKSPSELLSAGPTYEKELKMESKINEISEEKEWYVMGGNTFTKRGIKYADISEGEPVNTLIKDLGVGYVCAIEGINMQQLDEFLGLNPEKTDVISRDKVILKIENSEISQRLRLLNLYGAIIRHNSGSKKVTNYLNKLAKDEPEFIDSFVEYSIRMCLTSSHEWSHELFNFLKSNPEFYSRISEAHREFSIPFLLERDYHKRILDPNFDYNKKETQRELEDITKILNIDIIAIQKRLAKSGSKRKYMQK